MTHLIIQIALWSNSAGMVIIRHICCLVDFVISDVAGRTSVEMFRSRGIVLLQAYVM